MKYDIIQIRIVLSAFPVLSFLLVIFAMELFVYHVALNQISLSYILSLGIQLIEHLHRLLVPVTLVSIPSTQFLGGTYIANTIPPLNTSLPNLGSAPVQNVKNPSCLKIFTAQSMLFLYSLLASRLCIRVFTVSKGMVVYTVIVPAAAPSPKVLNTPNFSPGAT